MYLIKKVKIPFVFFLLVLNFQNLNALENKILFKVNNEIITSIDIFEEIKFLKAFNPEINNLKETELIEISKNSILRTESAIDLLERTKKFNMEWVKQGHRKGANTNNVSATISVKQDEWDQVGEWMWKNKNTFNGLSVLPYDNGSYTQAPFEDITEDKFKEMESHLNNINLKNIVEMSDETDLKDQAACAGGACEIV